MTALMSLVAPNDGAGVGAPDALQPLHAGARRRLERTANELLIDDLSRGRRALHVDVRLAAPTIILPQATGGAASSAATLLVVDLGRMRIASDTTDSDANNALAVDRRVDTVHSMNVCLRSCFLKIFFR